MHTISKRILTLCLMGFSGFVFAQEDTTNTDGQIDTERLIIVKQYSPTVSDAVKLKQLPDRKLDAETLKRKSVEYNIFSVPVASTFTPEKGKAASVKRQKRSSKYDNYAALGIGNYTNILAEFYSNINLENAGNIIIGLEHHSSQGGIEEVVLDDKYYNTQFNFGFNTESDNVYWNIGLGFQHQLYNWYGVNGDGFTPEQIAGIDPTHNYTGISLKGGVETKTGVFDKMTVQFNHFGDDYNGSENRLLLKPSFEFPVGEQLIKTDVFVDYLGGKFDDTFAVNGNYGWINIGVHPSFNILRDKWSLNIGAEVVYSGDTENSNSDFYVYPEVKASYRVAGDYFTLYAGVEGGLSQNTYQDFVRINPYLAPDLRIAPTNTKYHIYLGGKGKFTEQLHYDLHGSYSVQDNKALFRAYQPATVSTTPGLASYQYNNAFQLDYDEVKTFAIHGGLGYDLNKDFNIGISATYYNYSTSTLEKAWNLPNVEAAITADYQFAKNWSVGADFIYKGQRHDYSFAQAKTVDVDGYFDANLRLNFQVTDQFGLFARGSNLFGDNYEHWLGYPVQGIQGMFGLSFQF